MKMYTVLGRVLLTLPIAAMAMPIPAKASVDLLATITKPKDIRVTEVVRINKHIFIDVVLDKKYGGAAEADGVSNQSNTFNAVGSTLSGPEVDGQTAYGINRHAVINGSVNTNTGIVGVNQDVGNMVNQANVVAIALTTTPATVVDAAGVTRNIGSVVNSQAEADQKNERNTVVQREVFDRSRLDRSATISGSVNGNSGVVGVNQNSGNMNNQLNKLSLAIGPGAHVALSEAALGQVNAHNKVTEVATNRVDRIFGAASNNSGIVGVNQSSGNMNNQASVVSMAVLTSKVAITTP